MIGADALSRYVDWNDRGSCILFGDAAGAVLVQVRFSWCCFPIVSKSQKEDIVPCALSQF